MELPVRLKIRLGNQEFEYEGPSEGFKDVYQDFLSKLDRKSSIDIPQPTQAELPIDQEDTVGDSTPAKRTTKNGRGKKSYPNPEMDRTVNLHGNEDVPNLRTFFTEKNPSGKIEANAVFGFYLSVYVGRQVFTEGQIRACYVHVGIPLPAYIRQSLIDAKNKEGYVEPIEGGWKLTVRGENLVRHDLPRVKEST